MTTTTTTTIAVEWRTNKRTSEWVDDYCAISVPSTQRPLLVHIICRIRSSMSMQSQSLNDRFDDNDDVQRGAGRRTNCNAALLMRDWRSSSSSGGGSGGGGGSRLAQGHRRMNRPNEDERWARSTNAINKPRCHALNSAPTRTKNIK
jgi:hypothetical protein